CTTTPSPFSINVQAVPRQPRSPASARPTGPPPTTSTGTCSNIRLPFSSICKPARPTRARRRPAATASAQCLVQEGEGPALRQRRAVLAVARPLVAAEAVARAGIHEHFHLGPRLPDDLDVGQGNGLVGFAEMELNRAVRL